jgi:putative tryptophan/tyrosine transport system substrate-binding protein
MRRREFITFLGGAAVAWPLAARAQQSERMRRIGWLSTGNPISHRVSLAAFRGGLTALDYSEGRNIRIEYAWADGKVARLTELADDLVRRNVDIILAGGSLGAQAAKKATSLIPIVAAGAGDLVELGLASTLARPGGNLTGFVAAAPEAAAKRVQIMSEIVPHGRRAAILWNPDSLNAELERKVVNDSAATFQLTFTFHEARSVNDLEKTLSTIPQFRPDVLIVLNDPFVYTHRKIIVESAGQSRIPAIYGYREYVDDGGFVSYGTNISDTYRRAAAYVDRILRGEKASELPVQNPTRFELVINLKTAKSLDLEVPPMLLARADEVIE